MKALAPTAERLALQISLLTHCNPESLFVLPIRKLAQRHELIAKEMKRDQ